MNFDYTEYLAGLNKFEKENAPEELFFEGDIRLLTEGRRVSVVGTREPTTEGEQRAKIITDALVQEGIIVVSGLAKGIDTVVHNKAISSSGKTIAVLGTPLDVASPVSNRELLDEIKKEHLAISQFKKGIRVHKGNFPLRNRTMALISDATIIVEAKETSGTQSQGWEALRLGRLLFIMRNVAENPQITWVKKMIGYGALVLDREDIPGILKDIPNYTTSQEIAY